MSLLKIQKHQMVYHHYDYYNPSTPDRYQLFKHTFFGQHGNPIKKVKNMKKQQIQSIKYTQNGPSNTNSAQNQASYERTKTTMIQTKHTN